MCSSNFRTGLGVPQQFTYEPAEKRKRLGRPVNEDQENAFQMTRELVELNDEEQYTISDLVTEGRSF